MNQSITIWSDAIGNIGITEHQEKRSRLEWQAPGWDVYIRGAFPPSRYAAAASLMLDYLAQRSVPAISIRGVGR